MHHKAIALMAIFLVMATLANGVPMKIIFTIILFSSAANSNPAEDTLHLPNHYILVVGGEGDDKNLLDVVELKSIQEPLPNRLESRRLGKFPVKLKGLAGVTLGDASLPHVCGGGDGSKPKKECYVFNPQSNRWNISGRMSQARAFSGSAAHPDHGWVIAGGFGGGSSAEQTNDGKTLQPFAAPPLPLSFTFPCLVSLGKGGGGGDFFLTGGTMGDVVSKKAFIYDAGNWREMTDMPTARYELICGPVRSQPGGPVEKVVVAGGEDGSYLSMTEIYDVATNSWSKGTPLPVALSGAAVVPFETTFFFVGGHIGNRVYSDKVFLYDTSGEWREQPHMKLSQPKYGAAAMLVPSSLFD